MEELLGYRILDQLGAGGMAIVYRAEHSRLHHVVALKVLSEVLAQQPGIRERFLREAQIMASLQHPNIVRVMDFLEQDATLAIVMEFIEGSTLDHMIGKEVGPIPFERALPLFKSIVSGIAYAHARSIVHRDIKPSNVILDRTGQPRITDFGIAKITGQAGMTRTGAKMGTLYYMSPEQVRGAKDIDQRSDVYSLGMTFYEMLAGRLPFSVEGNVSEWDIMNAIVHESLPDPRRYYPHIPEPLVAIILQATAKDPGIRFSDCDLLLEALNTFSPSEDSGSAWRTGSTIDAPVGSVLGEIPLGERIPDFIPGPLERMMFARISTGSFRMGSPPGEIDRMKDEGAVHLVEVPAFELMSTPVTQAQWFMIMGTYPSRFKDSTTRDDLPVESVSWSDCQLFIQRMNHLYPDHRYRLPSEAEWEYACRAESTSRCFWGDDVDNDTLDLFCWSKVSGATGTQVVGQKMPNPWGLFDMNGNVWEWCEDWYHKDYSGSPSDGSPWRIPEGEDRIMRGGAWNNTQANLRSARRLRASPDKAYYYLGFRLARTARIQ